MEKDLHNLKLYINSTLETLRVCKNTIKSQRQIISIFSKLSLKLTSK
ncbi:conserved hypothetical protein (plasmid) [Borreliella garinii PBr]|uniref:Uncharacterized protein n=1 Tax=Borreliella garinii PBr TaxID=498743 RepID=B8F0M0_BORGR|nr:conserved hypothetical protein [Borreliella garinii PBr]